MNEKKNRLLQKMKSEFGSGVISALNDNSTIEIMLNPNGQVWLETIGGQFHQIGSLSYENAYSLLGTIASSLNTTITEENPIIEGELMLDGSRFEGIIPPIVSSPIFSIRKKIMQVYELDTYVQQDIMTIDQLNLIKKAIHNKKNILIVGGTGSGKTTFANSLIQCISSLYPQERLVIIEDTIEIKPSSEHCVMLRTSMHVDMLQLLRATLRLRPDRIIVGEVRGGEALSLLKAWNTGHPGGIATIHANSSSGAMTRLEQLIGETAHIRNVQSMIEQAIDLIVVISKHKGSRKIIEMVEI